MFKIKLKVPPESESLVLKSNMSEVLHTIQGEDGRSNYDLWLEAGNEGTLEEFLNSLKGKDGEDGFSPRVVATRTRNGLVLTTHNKNRTSRSFLYDGEDGESAYQIWLEQGNSGSEADFLKSLKGDKGDPGISGVVPTKVSQLENDSEFITDTYMKKYVSNAIASSGGGGGGGTGSSVKLENLSGFTTKSVAAGNSVILKFNFTSIVDEVSTGDGSCQIAINDVVKGTQKVKQGYNEIDVTGYLSAGTNTVIVRVTDIYGGFKLLNFTITMIDLRITTTFDDSKTYSDVIQYKYKPYGAIEKTIHILVDGTEIHTNTVTNSNQVTVNIPKQSHGVHRIEAFMTATLEDETLESNRIISDVICIEEGNSTVLISSVYEDEEMVQGEQVSIPYIVYNPASLTAEIELIVSCGGIEDSKKTITVDRKRQYWNVRNYPVGDVSFTIKCSDVSKTHIVTVTESDVVITPITNDLELYLTSTDRSNQEENPAKWEYGDVTTDFSEVNWDSTGWATDENGDSVLRLNGGATATISYMPF